MLIKSLKLENIRSYISEQINFPAGSVLLAGDIGSGKSTILLAIEFALFGLKLGELSGGELLRHGAREGCVELIFEAEDREIIVKRKLKRVKDKIAQTSGYLIIDDVKHELMPQEIRAKIFELLSYPQSMLTKGQDLIYRFTVYTPQEEMKKIIYEDKETRLETLRKVFNIDKYKRIRENALIYARELRERRSNFEGRIANLEEKKKQRKELSDKSAGILEEEKKAEDKLHGAKSKTSAKKEELGKIESQIRELNNLKKEKAILEIQLKNIVDKREKEKKEIDELTKSIISLKDEVVDFKDDIYLQNIFEDKERRLETVEKELLSIRNDKSEIRGKMSHLKQVSEKVRQLSSCPLCLQDVSHEHKNSILIKSHSDIENLEKNYEELTKKETELSSMQDALRKEIKGFREKITINKTMRIKKENLLEKEKKLSEIKENFEKAKKEIADINSKKIELDKKIVLFSRVEEDYLQAKKQHEELLNEERRLELEKNSLQKEREGMEKQLKSLDIEIEEKERIKNELKKIINLQNWLQETFVNLVTSIEKHVLMTVYHEFNEYFKQWFSMLIEDDNINVRLDDSFSVLVEQNGYETYVENLSGGEKTSIALAYRLALNKVINDVVSQIKTKDIIILDEPTEGFSNNQLDRVRDVLDQLKVRQTIIVSHESKIETFVDNIIRISKKDGVSMILLS